MIDYVEIRNSNRVLIGVIDTAQSIIWKSEYYGAGAFEIYVAVTDNTVELLKVGNYVTRNNDVNIGIIESINVTFSLQYGRMIVASGRFAKSILDRRLVMKLSTSGTGGKISILPTVSRGLVEVAARQLVTDNIISSSQTARNISFVKLGSIKNIGKKIVDEDGKATEKQTSFGNLLEYTDSLLQEFELGAYMSLDKTNMDILYNVYQGADRSKGNTAGNVPLIFSQDFDNLLSSDYKYDIAPMKNTALIGGEGEGIERFCAMVGVNAAGLNRREVWIDASGQSRTYKNNNGEDKEYTDDEYLSLIKSYGKKQLLEYQEEQTFVGEIDLSNSILVFGSDYWLGDLITIQDISLGLYVNTRILTATEVQDQNGYKLDITYGV